MASFFPGTTDAAIAGSHLTAPNHTADDALETSGVRMNLQFPATTTLLPGGNPDQHIYVQAVDNAGRGG